MTSQSNQGQQLGCIAPSIFGVYFATKEIRLQKLIYETGFKTN